MSGPRAPKPSPLAGEGAEDRRSEAGEGAFAATSDRARVLRSRLTHGERKLWYALRDRRFAGAKFRRQVPVGPYVADFLCYEARLVIEVDGGQHVESAKDRRRDRWFANNAFRVLRFWNNDVHSNLEGVLMVIIDALRATPHPARAARGHPSPGQTRVLPGLAIHNRSKSETSDLDRGEGTGAPSLRSAKGERREVPT